jgi:hypothetical protein
MVAKMAQNFFLTENNISNISVKHAYFSDSYIYQYVCNKLLGFSKRFNANC